MTSKNEDHLKMFKDKIITKNNITSILKIKKMNLGWSFLFFFMISKKIMGSIFFKGEINFYFLGW